MTLQFKSKATCKDREVNKCINPYLLILRQTLLLSPGLRCCLDLSCDVQVLMLKMSSLHLIFTSYIISTAFNDPKPPLPDSTCIYFYSLYFSNMYI